MTTKIKEKTICIGHSLCKQCETCGKWLPVAKDENYMACAYEDSLFARHLCIRVRDSRAKVNLFTRYTFGEKEIKKEVIPDHDGTEHEKYNRLVENFNYSRGTNEWGCPYCGSIMDRCWCIKLSN